MKQKKNNIPDFTQIEKKGLYIPELEHDSCGVGVVANIRGNISHEIINQGITVLKNLSHRGAAGADRKTGDGAGMMTQIPHKFFNKITTKNNISLPKQGEYGVGMFFLPNHDKQNNLCKEIIENTFIEKEFQILGWRNVEINEKSIGLTAKSLMPSIEQIFISKQKKDNEIERELYVVRKSI